MENNNYSIQFENPHDIFFMNIIENEEINEDLICNVLGCA